MTVNQTSYLSKTHKRLKKSVQWAIYLYIIDIIYILLPYVLYVNNNNNNKRGWGAGGHYLDVFLLYVVLTDFTTLWELQL